MAEKSLLFDMFGSDLSKGDNVASSVEIILIFVVESVTCESFSP